MWIESAWAADKRCGRPDLLCGSSWRPKGGILDCRRSLPRKSFTVYLIDIPLIAAIASECLHIELSNIQ